MDNELYISKFMEEISKIEISEEDRMKLSLLLGAVIMNKCINIVREMVLKKEFGGEE